MFFFCFLYIGSRSNDLFKSCLMKLRLSFSFLQITFKTEASEECTWNASVDLF